MQEQKIRIEKQRVLKRDIRGSLEHLIVGIDIGKEKHYAFFGDANGRSMLRRFTFPNTKEGFDKLLRKTEEIKKRGKFSDVVYGMEPTANYHKPLGEWLIHKGYMVTLVGSTAVKRNRELLDGRWDKNDTKDSANIADLISQGKCLFYDQTSSDITELRALLSFKKKLKKEAQGIQVRIRNHLLAQYFPELDPYFNKLEEECLAILKSCFSPKKISLMEYEDFLSLIIVKGKILKQKKRLWEIWNTSKDSIGCIVSDSVQFEAESLALRLEETKCKIRQIDKKVLRICESFPEYQSLLSIPGFGPMVSSITLAAIGDPYRFQNRKQVLKLVGLDLSASRSGNSASRAVAKISKKGKADLRYALYQAAFTASTRSKVFIPYFAQKAPGRSNERGIGTKMRVKLSAKLLTIAWTLMKTKELFDPSHLQLQEED